MEKESACCSEGINLDLQALKYLYNLLITVNIILYCKYVPTTSPTTIYPAIYKIIMGRG